MLIPRFLPLVFAAAEAEGLTLWPNCGDGGAEGAKAAGVPCALLLGPADGYGTGEMGIATVVLLAPPAPAPPTARALVAMEWDRELLALNRTTASNVEVVPTKLPPPPRA